MKLLAAIGCLFTSIEASQYSLINCSWPCVNPENGCIVTSERASCRNRDSNSWMINTPLKAPFYTGAYVSITGQACQPAPIPALPAASLEDNATNPGQSVIMWPTTSSRRPLDEYLGNCGHGLYCSSVGEDKLNPVCRTRFTISSTCVSSNQCLSGFCVNGSCQLSTNNTSYDGHGGRHWKNDDNGGNTTVQILASVFGIISAITVSAVGFVVYRRYRRNKQQQQEIGKEENNIAYVPNHEHSQSTDSVASLSNAPLSTNNNLHKQFASDFLHEESTVTPAMQQNQLQHDMLRSHDEEDITYLAPPPSYKP